MAFNQFVIEVVQQCHDSSFKNSLTKTTSKKNTYMKPINAAGVDNIIIYTRQNYFMHEFNSLVDWE